MEIFHLFDYESELWNFTGISWISSLDQLNISQKKPDYYLMAEL